jgi:SAM-dependent methyltransferase
MSTVIESVPTHEERWPADAPARTAGPAPDPEADALLSRLEMPAGGTLLDVGCGSGALAVRAAIRFGAEVTGVDDDGSASAALDRARAAGVDARTRFLYADPGERLPLPDASFDAIVCRDAIRNVRRRARFLAEMRRLLKPGGRLVFTDPAVLSGSVTSDEVAVLASRGPLQITPPGENERLLEEVGFAVLGSDDHTDEVSREARDRAEARRRKRSALRALEGAMAYERTRQLLHVTQRLAAERRLSRIAFLARK